MREQERCFQKNFSDEVVGKGNGTLVDSFYIVLLGMYV